ncbi:hypothetical protein [Aquirhabdus parva]|uniref:Uncharacterized protein n=1 Tax=Aquirhabdus parva TaxID=2283318 RepID=A0A345P930_9GAMM|nr:hypothetical protein [Aquirhabdus parva]AXI03789.1 hypothetical protein HYN46_13680 [Aquirhabdus parva]
MLISTKHLTNYECRDFNEPNFLSLPVTIQWPLDKHVALHLFLKFQLHVLEKLNIQIANEVSQVNDPQLLATEYLAGHLSFASLDSARVQWWDYIDDHNGITNFQDRNLLMARLAVCLLMTKVNEGDTLQDHLDWFIEFLKALGEDSKKVTALKKDYFNLADRI